MGRKILCGIVGIALFAGTGTALAQEVTLRGVSSFAEGTQFSKGFERFIERVNKDGKAPLLCVTEVMDIASGKLDLSGKIREEK